MNKNKTRIITFLLLGSLLLSGCQKNNKNHNNGGAYIEYPPDTTLSQVETIIPSNPTETVPETSQPIVTTPVETLPEETIPEETTPDESTPEETIPEETIPDDPIKEEPVVENKEAIVVEANTTVNLRSSNTSESLQLDQLQIYDKAYKIMSCDNGWDLIRYNDKIGYVFRDYITYTDEEYVTEYKHFKYEDIVLTTGSLNFREQPNTSSKIISTFKENTELQVIAVLEDSDWILVKYNGVIGYVHSGYVTSLLDRANSLYPELQLESLKTKKVVYTTSNLNFRVGNSTDFESLGMLEKYETLRVVGEYDGWYFVMTNDYNFGFVSTEYTEVLEDRFVIVDKSEQQLFLYEDNELLYTTPVTTGKDSTPSDTGLFKIKYKAKDVTLSDNKTYWSPVRYWMPYNGGEGLHDADWRSVFGGEDYHYNGSHGCINMPVDITDEIYNNVETGTKVLVHK